MWTIIPMLRVERTDDPPPAGYLFQALSVFSFVCWVVPNNVPVNQLFGVSNGLGMSLLTFDWNEIAWTNSPLMVPWWAQVHTMAGFVLFFWIVTPILYYTNVRGHSYYPYSFRSHGIFI